LLQFSPYLVPLSAVLASDVLTITGDNFPSDFTYSCSYKKMLSYSFDVEATRVDSQTLECSFPALDYV